MANNPLAAVAVVGVESASWAPLEKGWCQVFARLCYEKVYGKAFERFRRSSAKLTGLAFQAGGLAMTPQQAGPLQAGDLLYKVHGSGDYGHVGIYVGGDRIAENSSTSIGRVRGYLGYRTVSQFGKFDLVVRLAPPKDATPTPEPPNKPVATKPARLILAVNNGDKDLSYVHVERAALSSGKFTVDVPEVAKVLMGNTGPIREVLDDMGWEVYDEGNHLGDVVDPRQYLFVRKFEEVHSEAPAA